MALVFVYGTLKTGERNFEKYMQHATSLGQTCTMEPSYLMGHHKSASSENSITPGVVRADHDGHHVHGEVFEISDAGIARLDALEGIGGDTYYREEIMLEDGRSAWIYRRYGYGADAYKPSSNITMIANKNAYTWKEIPAP